MRLSQELSVGGALVVLFAGFGAVQPRFAEPGNVIIILRQAVEPALIAFGQGFAMLAGGFDLSVGGNINLVSTLAAEFAIDFGTVPGMAMALTVGLLIGLANGILIAGYGLPAFIVTLGMGSLCSGLALLISGGLPIYNLPANFSYVGATATVGPVPLPIVIAGVVFLILWMVVSRTRFGYHVYAIGGDENAARLAGIKVVRVRTLVYVISGVMAASAGVMLSMRVDSGQPTVGVGTELLSVAAVIIGGVRLRGGQGSLVGVLIGVILLAEIANGLNLINMPSYVQLVVTGMLVIIASLGSVIRSRRAVR